MQKYNFIKLIYFKWKLFTAKIINLLFVVYETSQSRLFTKRKIKILFSKKTDWQHPIKRGFYATRHEIGFDELSYKNIKDYDLIVPLTIDDLKYLNEARHLLFNNPIPIPRIETILLCDDKYALNQKLIENGFGSIVPKMGDGLSYPYILKKSIDDWGRNCHIIENKQQELIYSDKSINPNYFSQELIVGQYEYAMHILFKDNNILCSINIEYFFEIETPIKGKDKEIYQKICRQRYLDTFTSILISIGFEGLCCINYKVRDNRPFIIEINPRFGGSLSPYFFSFMRLIE